MKVNSNGRSTYEELRKNYDKVIIRHNRNDDGTVKTICVLAKENNIFVGVSKFSNRTYTYNRKKGRLIAQGRAEHAAKVALGLESERNQEIRREPLSFSILQQNPKQVENLIESFIS